MNIIVILLQLFNIELFCAHAIEEDDHQKRILVKNI